MAKHVNLARMMVDGGGTGPLTLLGASTASLTFAQAGVVNGDVVSYSILNGNNREVGRGTYNDGVLTRTTVLHSTNSNSAINVVGAGEVMVTLLAEDLTPEELGAATPAQVSAGDAGVLATIRAGVVTAGDNLSKLYALITGHTGNTSNPHNTTASQVGAPTTAQMDAADTGVINTLRGGVIAAGDTLAKLYTLITNHTSNVSNPHNVTAAQAGAAPTVHTHTAAQISDSSATGRSVLTAANAAAVRTAVGSGAVGDALFTAATQAVARQVAGVPVSDMRNKIINPLFSVNQRAVAGTVVLPAGQYGHDRFKAGSSGCTYTFATSNGVTTITITAGSLQQIIEASAFAGEAGTYVLSWAGTAFGRIGTGSYGTSGNVSTAVTGGANVTVEWNTGTLSLPQLEKDYVTPFTKRAYATELAMCQRYFEKTINPGYRILFANDVTSGSAYFCQRAFMVRKRVAPSMTLANVYNDGFPAAVGTVGADVEGFTEYRVASTTGPGKQYQSSWEADAEL